MTTEKCTICGEEKPLDRFSKSARNEKRGVRHGRRSDCKDCQKVEEANRKAGSHESYADRVIAALKSSGKPMSIHDLRDLFPKTMKTQAAITSALKSLVDRGDIRVCGGGHGSSVKMIEIVPEIQIQNGARMVRLSDVRHWDEPPIRSHWASLQSGMPYMALMCG